MNFESTYAMQLKGPTRTFSRFLFYLKAENNLLIYIFEFATMKKNAHIRIAYLFFLGAQKKKKRKASYTF